MSIQTSIQAKLKRYNGVSYDTVGEVLSISYSGLEMAVVDSTHLNSASQHRTFLGGMIDPGTIDIQVNIDPTSADAEEHVAIRTDLTGRAAVDYRIVFPDGEYMQASCLVTKYGSIEFSDDGMATLNVSLKLSGALTWADVES
jgi:predicted secreted protein